MAAEVSLAERLAVLPAADRSAVLDRMPEDEIAALVESWELVARPKQLPPEDDWFVWLMLGGRGSGKTRAGAEWLHRRAMEGNEDRWMALVAETPGDARDDCIDGPGGLLKNLPPGVHHEQIVYEPSRRRITWPTGAYATIYSGAHPEQIRGFSGDTAWCDEFAAWKYPRKSWENLLLASREKKVSPPRICVTTTPRPLSILREILEWNGAEVVRMSTYDNRANLAETFFEHVVTPLEGTRLGRQEIHAEIVEDTEGALVSDRAWIEDHRDHPDDAEAIMQGCRRLAVGVDPAGWRSGSSDETGIVVAGTDGRRLPHLYVFEDRSGRMSARGWAAESVAALSRWEGDAVVAETNYGGEMVVQNLRAADPDLPVEIVRATRGKRVRAEPLGHLYEQGRVHHVGTFPELEDQLCRWRPGSSESPDRLDALVWAASWAMGWGDDDVWREKGDYGVTL